jgi:hypothetical protein
MEEVTKGTYLKMLMVVKFVIQTKKLCLRIKSEFNGEIWSLRVFCDSDWAHDSGTRISVTGFTLPQFPNINVSVLFIRRSIKDLSERNNFMNCTTDTLDFLNVLFL